MGRADSAVDWRALPHHRPDLRPLVAPRSRRSGRGILSRWPPGRPEGVWGGADGIPERSLVVPERHQPEGRANHGILRTTPPACYAIHRMGGQDEKASRNPRRSRLLWFLVPVLLFAQVLGGRAALLHAHDEVGQHLHMLALPPAESSSCVTAEWHHSQHEGDKHEHLMTNAPVEDHGGVLIELPSVLVAGPCANVTGAAMAAHLQALHVTVLCTGVLLRPPPLPTVVRAELPQVRRQRTGTAMLLGSSRALLI